MPKFQGVYEDAKGRWYFKVTLGHDALTSRRVQVTKMRWGVSSTNVVETLGLAFPPNSVCLD